MTAACFCGGGGCLDTARDPRYSVLGLPISAYGVAAFLALWTLALAGGTRPGFLRRGTLLAVGLSLAASAVSLVLLVVMVFAERRVCNWCCASAGLFACTLAANVSLLGSDRRLTGRGVRVASLGSAFLAAAALALGQIFFPRRPL